MKMKFFRWLIFLLLFALLKSCGPGLNDYAVELGRGYTYRSDGRYTYIYGQSKSIRRRGFYSKIINYSFNKDFILVKQAPDREGHVFSLMGALNTGEQEIDSLKAQAEAILKMDPYYQKVFSRKVNYYIVSHKNDSTYGPLNAAEFNELRMQLGIPDELTLEAENDLNYVK